MNADAESPIDRTVEDSAPATERGGFQPPKRLESFPTDTAEAVKRQALQERIKQISAQDEEEKIAEIARLRRLILGDETVLQTREVTTVTSADIDAGLAARGMRMKEDGTIEKIPTREEQLRGTLQRRAEQERAGRKAAEALSAPFTDEEIESGLNNLPSAPVAEQIPVPSARTRLKRALKSAAPPPPPAE